MARTPLLSAIQQLFVDHAAARRLKMPVADVRGIRAERRGRGFSRREILAGAGAGALALGAPRIASAAGAPSIGIVGGGIAGLTCALKLRDHNIASTVYEASGRIGGRMFSNRTSFFGGQIVEWLGELIDTGHKTVRQLAKRFDLPLIDVLDAQPAGAEDTFYFFGQHYPKAQADIDFEPVLDAVSADAADAPFPTLFDDFTMAGLALDQMSIYDWIESRVPGGHSSAFGQLLDAAYNIEYGAETTDQSSLSLIYLLAFQPKPNELAVFGESDERFRIAGGNQQLPEAIANELGIGTTVKLGHKLLAITKTPAGRYKLTFQDGACTKEFIHDFVVLAVPFPVLDDINTTGAGFDSLKQQAISELGRGKNGKLHLQFQNRIWNGPGAWPGISSGSSFADTGYQATWESTRGQPGSNGIFVVYSGGNVTSAMTTTTAFAKTPNANVQADALNALTQLEPVFPGLTAQWTQKATQSLPHKSDLFKLAYSYYRVGQYTAFGGYEKERQGGILFAGEHTSTDFQGYMEGGAEQGKRAANELRTLI